MKRKDFLRSIIGTVAVATIPVKSQATEKEYRFDEVFEQPCNNDILYYPKKDCELYREIKKHIGTERILEKNYFRAYLGYHYNLIPIKETYTISDFMSFILASNSHYKKNDVFAEYDRGVFFRMIQERCTKTMYFDVFLARS